MKKTLRYALALFFCLLFVFSGWLQIAGFPPVPKEALAASPLVVSRGNGTSGNATTLTVTLTGTPASGDLYVVFLQSQTNTVTWSQNTGTTGWVELADTNGQAIFYKQIGASEPNPTFIQSQSTRSGYGVLQITGHENPATQAPEVGTQSTGTGSAPNPPSITPTGGSKDYLFIAVGGNNDARRNYTVAPTNYTNLNAFNTSGGPNGGAGATAERELTASTENPDTFTMDGSATWFSNIIAVHPEASTAPTVSTNAATSVTSNAATINGEITDTGGANATVRGFVWGTSATLSGGDTATTTESGTFGISTFSSNRTSLSPSTVYYFRAYATNVAGTGYGSILNFTTESSLPVASGVSINGGATSINLTENTTTAASCVGTVSDGDGFADITSVTADFYRTSVGTGGGTNNNNYYQMVGDAQCVPSGGSGNSEVYTCDFSVQYYADPTDAGSAYEADSWTCNMTPSDSGGAGTSASDTIEMNSLVAIDISSTISYGLVNPNSNTGATNSSLTVTNTGNNSIDVQLSGTDMTSGGNTLAVANQEYSLSPFTYGTGTTLSATATSLAVDLAQPTSATVPVQDIIYWGINVPNGTPEGVYGGTNTVTAIQ